MRNPILATLAPTVAARPFAVSISTARDAVIAANPALAAAGTFLALALIPSTLALGLDDRLLSGVSVWVKPMKFQASLAVHLLSVAVLLLLLPHAVRRSRQVRWIAAAMTAAALGEAAYITLRAAQAAQSHFASDTTLAIAAYQLMGLGAVILVGGAAWIGVLVLRHGEGPAPLVLGAGMGLVLGGLLGGVTGFAISAAGGHWVGGAPSDAGGLPIVGWVRDGGDLGVAHFVGMHLIQGLPAFGLLLWAMSARHWRALILGAAALGVLVTLGTYVQAALGRPIW